MIHFIFILIGSGRVEDRAAVNAGTPREVAYIIEVVKKLGLMCHLFFTAEHLTKLQVIGKVGMGASAGTGRIKSIDER